MYIEMLENQKPTLDLIEAMQNMLDDCYDLGLDLFQGYFLQKPEIIREKSTSHHKTQFPC